MMFKILAEEVLDMKKSVAVLVVVLVSLCLVGSFAFAGEMKATVKAVDAKQGKIVVTMDGKDHELKAEKDVDLSSVKAGEAVEISMDKNMLKSIKAAGTAAPAPKASVGC
jgi:hypothetical protein